MRCIHEAARAAALSLCLASAALPAGAADTRISIDNFTFSPQTVTVPAGTRVVWVNRDDIPHTVVNRDDPHLFRSKPLDTGDRFAVVLARAGIYHYFCSIHPMMQGTIVVK